LLTVCTWRWGSKYPGHYVDRLSAGLERHLKQPFRFEVFSPLAEDVHLTKILGCFCRLRMFDPAWQARHGIDDRLVCIDLDTVMTGSLDELFDRPEKFVILQGANASNPCPFNGSLMMLRAGARPDVWADFSIKRAGEVPFFAFPDDQGWLWHKIPDAAGWKVGPDSGVYAYQKPGWPEDNQLPADARVVAFPGWRDPSRFQNEEWVRKHWAA
jgi:hypothetical protein